ncbi:MAG: spore cortex biosynthesis protein YabQ [Eubacterium sp.]
MLYIALIITGLSCGIVFSAVSFVEKIIHLKFVYYILDIVMLSLFALAYFCTAFAYNDGNIRFYHFAIFAFSFTVYIKTLHKVMLPVFDNIANALHRPFKKFTKRLNISKKSVKNLLHYKH